MPLYEYECEACAHRFERIQKYSDPPIDVCPKCGSNVRKLISSPAIQFKGSGFYITDYPKSGSDRSSGGKAEKSGDSKSGDSKSSDGKSSDGKSSDSKSADSKSSDSGSTAKTESKAETKSESKAEAKS